MVQWGKPTLVVITDMFARAIAMSPVVGVLRAVIVAVVAAILFFKSVKGFVLGV